MKYLLDVNALIALGHRSHVHHSRAIAWFQAKRNTASALCTCAITELGFVRIAVQTGLQQDVVAARRALHELKTTTSITFELLADELGADRLPAFAKTPSKLTDGHLLELARQHGIELLTLDTGIPGASVIP